ncbi:MAG: substrate-binding periplasmic protein [Betaproteobacteria bacterium]
MNRSLASFVPVLAKLGLPVCLLAGGISLGAESLLVTYPEKPPYYYTESGVAKGGLLDLAQKIFANAGVPVRFASRPAPRVLNDMAETGEPVCSLGWFKTPERERFARFSRPFFRDFPNRILVRVDRAARFKRFASLEDLLAAPGVRIGIVAGFSYGARPDEWLQRAGEQVTARVARVEQLFEMVRHDRIDVALVNQIEYLHFARPSADHAPDLQTLLFADAPAGNLRYIMCSRAVPPSTLERIDAAILRLGFQINETRD